MHVQVPTRVLYINGFKGLRAMLDRHIDAETFAFPNAARLGTMIGPGLLMTPVSSFLEASNAGHANPEPLVRRSLRGTVPRMFREVIFGIGINQMSEFAAERFRTMPRQYQVSSSPLASSMAGSVTAGALAGYASHIPHNLSTLKLMDPNKTYGELFRKFVDSSAPERFLPRGLPAALVGPVRIALACLFPRGVLVRTVQIVGSFCILNGGIHALELHDQQRFGKAMAAFSDSVSDSDASS
jgi:hypothetical protein